MATVSQSAALDRGAVQGQRILVVEDEPEIQDLLADTLALEGFQVRTVGDAYGVLSLVRRLQPDLVILDLRLPGVSGIQLLPLLVNNTPDLPILVVSGAHALLREYSVEFRRLSVKVLSKPFTLDQFLSAVRQSLASRPSQPPASPPA